MTEYGFALGDHITWDYREPQPRRGVIAYLSEGDYPPYGRLVHVTCDVSTCWCNHPNHVDGGAAYHVCNESQLSIDSSVSIPLTLF